MNIINQLKGIHKDQNITVLIRDPGLYETYVDYFIGDNKERLRDLENKKQKGDLIPTMKVGVFIQYFKDREGLLQISRESKILSTY